MKVFRIIWEKKIYDKVEGACLVVAQNEEEAEYKAEEGRHPEVKIDIDHLYDIMGSGDWTIKDVREIKPIESKCRQELMNVVMDSKAIDIRMSEIEERVEEVNGINIVLLEKAEQILEETK